MAVVNFSYAAKTAITVTLTSITTGNGRASTVIDNTTNKYLDAIVRVQTNGQTGATGTVDIYVYSALGDTTYTDGITGTDAAVTVANMLNAQYLDSVKMNTTTAVSKTLRSVASAFGGVMPDKWGLLFINNSGGTLSATAGNHVVEFEGITQTVA
jgi:hypothetical protein